MSLIELSETALSKNSAQKKSPQPRGIPHDKNTWISIVSGVDRKGVQEVNRNFFILLLPRKLLELRLLESRISGAPGGVLGFSLGSNRLAFNLLTVLD